MGTAACAAAPERIPRRAELESLLRARKLDTTLAPPAWEALDADARALAADLLAPTGVADIDAALGGGLRRGHLSEIVGARSAGCTTVRDRIVAAATARGELAALVDACDRFDPAPAAAAGVDLGSLLWIRETGDAGRALKALNLVVQAGGFGVAVLDVADLPPRALKQLPYTTWIRLARAIEGSPTVAVLVGRERLARSPGGATIALDCAGGRWSSGGDRARRLEGVALRPRVIRAR